MKWVTLGCARPVCPLHHVAVRSDGPGAEVTVRVCVSLVCLAPCAARNEGTVSALPGPVRREGSRAEVTVSGLLGPVRREGRRDCLWSVWPCAPRGLEGRSDCLWSAWPDPTPQVQLLTFASRLWVWQEVGQVSVDN